MSIDECRIKEFFLFYLLKRAERSDIHNSSIVNLHSSFHEVSFKRFRVNKTVNRRISNIEPQNVEGRN
jgi:hypothetical protein